MYLTIFVDSRSHNQIEIGFEENELRELAEVEKDSDMTFMKYVIAMDIGTSASPLINGCPGDTIKDNK